MASGGSFCAILTPGSQMAFRRSQVAHFEHFWHLVAKWFFDGLRKLILSNSSIWWPNGSQISSERLFLPILTPSDQMAPRSFRRLILSNSDTWQPNGFQSVSGAHFEHLWHLVAKWLLDGLRKFILSDSGTWWPNGSQMVSETHFDKFWHLVTKWLPNGSRDSF